MAQILEAKGIFVTIILLEGDTNVLTSLANSFFSNDNFIYKLNTQFSSYYNEVNTNCLLFGNITYHKVYVIMTISMFTSIMFNHI